MKTIGLIGGMSWQSTARYYALLNRLVNERLGGHHSAKILLYSIDFHELSTKQHAGEWDAATQLVVDAAKRLERGGADLLLICANTMHISAPAVEKQVRLPLLHIADATAERILLRGIHCVGLLGTAFTMEREFYRDRLRDKFGLEVIVPEEFDRKIVHDIIFNELVAGVVKPESRARLRDIIARLEREGAQGVILGCTELMMILDQTDSAVPLFDTTTIHCEAAVERALIDATIAAIAGPVGA